jgi:hypothetical protein
MRKKDALYLRISHRDQSHASQLPDLERWVEAHDGPVEWFKDTFTGRTMERPGMDRLLVELRAGRLNRIVVWRLDRLGRTTRGLWQLFEELDGILVNHLYRLVLDSKLQVLDGGGVPMAAPQGLATKVPGLSRLPLLLFPKSGSMAVWKSRVSAPGGHRPGKRWCHRWVMEALHPVNKGDFR